MNADFDPSELSDLLVRVRVGGTLDEQQRRLIELLSASPAARRYYVEQVIVSVLLAEAGDDLFDRMGGGLIARDNQETDGASLHDSMVLLAIREEPTPAAQATVPAPVARVLAAAADPQRVWRRRRWVGLAAVLLMGSCLVALLLKPSPGCVTLVGAIDAKWKNLNVAIDPGAILPGSELELTVGLVQIGFPSGARAVIEAPARFRAEAPNRLSLRAGKVSAWVPEQAHGFTVATASASVVDLGTEFGVVATEDGNTDVSVVQGKVSVAPKGVSADAALRVSAGLAMEVNSAGIASAHPASASAFVLPRDFDAAAASTGNGRFKRWRAYSERIRRAPGLVAYYTFQDATEAPDRLLNHSPAGHGLDGILGDFASRPQWGVGRFPEKGALRFDPSKRHRVVIPDSPALDFSHGAAPASPFTLCVWAKAAVQQPRDTGLICRGGWYAEQYSIDVLSSPSGYRAWVRKRPGRDGDTTLSSGQLSDAWCFVASVYDPANKTLTLYINGQRAVLKGAPEVLMPAEGAVYIGSRLGNGDPPSWITFNGSIDEVAIYRRALPGPELLAAYEAGRPD